MPGSSDLVDDIETARADVLDPAELPAWWEDYDLIVSASMLEYVPPERLASALRGLGSLLRPDGRLVLFITRRNWLTRLRGQGLAGNVRRLHGRPGGVGDHPQEPVRAVHRL